MGAVENLADNCLPLADSGPIVTTTSVGGMPRFTLVSTEGFHELWTETRGGSIYHHSFYPWVFANNGEPTAVAFWTRICPFGDFGR